MDRNRWIMVAAVVAVVGASTIGVAIAAPGSSRARPKLPVARLVKIARGTASGLGDSQVKTALVVVTTKNAAENWMEPGAIPPGPTNPRAYVIVLKGRFVCESCSAPAGAQLPHGHSAQIIWVPGRGVTDFGLTPHNPPGLRRLGRVVTISLGAPDYPGARHR
jgi:hypothetical protein